MQISSFLAFVNLSVSEIAGTETGWLRTALGQLEVEVIQGEGTGHSKLNRQKALILLSTSPSVKKVRNAPKHFPISNLNGTS